MKTDDFVYLENGIWTYRMSRIGACIRSLVAARMGESPTPPHQKFQEFLDASAGLEDEVIAMYIAKHSHGEVIWRQKEVELPIAEGVIVRGHIDGLDQQDDEIIEVKALGDRYFELYNNGGFEALGVVGLHYRWQGAGYGHATHRQVRFVIGHKAEGKDGWVIDELIVEPAVDPETLVPLNEILSRIASIEHHAGIDVYPDCDRKCSKSEPFAHIHVFDPVTLGGSDLEAMLERYDNMQSTIDEIVVEKEKLGQEIKKQYGKGTHVAGSFKAILLPNKGEKCNTKRLKQERPDVYEEFLEPYDYGLRLQVKSSAAKRGEQDA